MVVVLDSTMRGEGVEVVAFPRSDRDGDASGVANSPHATRARRTPTALEDSATMLAERFRAARDSLNDEVSRLEALDRRSRAYAVRYAEIRRRTLAAEQLRARRDSVNARVMDSRGEADPGSLPARSAAADSLPVLAEISELHRRPASDSIVTLELAPGRWYIGVARDGRLISAPTERTIVSGDTDTLRITRRALPAGATP